MRGALGEAIARRGIAELFTGNELAQELGEVVSAGPLEVQEDELVRRDHGQFRRSPNARSDARTARGSISTASTASNASSEYGSSGSSGVDSMVISVPSPNFSA